MGKALQDRRFPLKARPHVHTFFVIEVPTRAEQFDERRLGQGPLTRHAVADVHRAH